MLDLRAPAPRSSRGETGTLRLCMCIRRIVHAARAYRARRDGSVRRSFARVSTRSAPAVVLEKRKRRTPGGKEPAAEVQAVHVPLQAHPAEPASFDDGRVRGGGGVLRRPAHRRRLGRLECGPHPAAAAVGTVRRSRGRAEDAAVRVHPREGGPVGTNRRGRTGRVGVLMLMMLMMLLVLLELLLRVAVRRRFNPGVRPGVCHGVRPVSVRGIRPPRFCFVVGPRAADAVAAARGADPYPDPPGEPTGYPECEEPLLEPPRWMRCVGRSSAWSRTAPTKSSSEGSSKPPPLIAAHGSGVRQRSSR